jgi:hypothetical protein
VSYTLENFGRRFKDSLKYVNYIAYLLQRAGIGVILPPARVRAESEDRKPFEKSTDIYAFLDARKRLPLEVKSKNVEFGTPDSWPFEDVTLYNANKASEPYAVILVSRDTLSPLVVVRDGTWYERDQGDGDPDRNGLRYKVLAAPKASLLTWEVFAEKLREELRASCSSSG